ncbi:MAG: CBS domain-containing protein [Nitrospinales bacterium]
MKVKELMTKKVITLSPNDNVDSVFILFHFEAIRHIPVLENGDLVGILSDRDLKKILGSQKRLIDKSDGSITFPSKKVKHIMTRRVVSIGPDQRAAAAAIMAKRKFDALPVLHKGKLVGIITSTDILRAFLKLCNELQAIRLEGLSTTCKQLEKIGESIRSAK